MERLNKSHLIRIYTVWHYFWGFLTYSFFEQWFKPDSKIEESIQKLRGERVKVNMVYLFLQTNLSGGPIISDIMYRIYPKYLVPYITKIRLFNYIENFASKKLKIFR